ncbi:MAG: hypothetical protein A2919_01130 [Candidatus Spechtbacteria bacterium RIFCSPLOWO2_01_FULL_43_12]|uniref:Uncharacterized protein n=1 Tax=Candidatus Spechtbacteria bacterium RIFCSPLOWO2_01_FULL_43_12 TaxID=1802162 RepID=A0A1G2HE40_9BACT|nr:MAG: hypothetical protein A2919_01130 [Candidatus Spechtbacteria bacterium RIFCSPLOWO2_01_FULL_43_12]
MTESYLLTKIVAQKAIDIVSASFMAAVEMQEAKRPAIHIVVMDPTKRPEMGFTFEEAILCEVSVGEAEKYIPIARAKAKSTWIHRMPAQEIQQFYPHLLEKGATKWGGSAYLHHISVGASGVQYQIDQWVSELVASTCRALCVGAMINIMNSDATFLGE